MDFGLQLQEVFVFDYPMTSSSRNRTSQKCPDCLMREVLCLCPLIPRLSVATRLTVLMYWKESYRTSNTAKLASLILPNSEIRVRGDIRRPMSTEGLIPDRHQTLLLFPTEDAIELTPAQIRKFERPIHLIVPDGNWSQARKVGSREPALIGVPRVKLGPDQPSTYRLRKSHHLERVSTFEAIARAMGLIEGPHVQEAMENFFELFVERRLWSRGKLPLSECKTEIPQAAIQKFHDDGCKGTPRRK